MADKIGLKVVMDDTVVQSITTLKIEKLPF